MVALRRKTNYIEGMKSFGIVEPSVLSLKEIIRRLKNKNDFAS